MSSIRGLQKTTLIDYPGKIACTIFFSGCNLRCPFCHNRDLVLKKRELPFFSEDKILRFLSSRIEILEGVVLTGGEPLLYQNLEGFVKRIKDLGFLVKLDTNGELFPFLAKIVQKGLIDYLAMDFKSPIEKYEEAVGGRVDKEAVLKSMRFLISATVDYEFRTTVVPGIHQEEDLFKMAQELRNLASSYQPVWFLQQFRPGNCLDPQFNKITPYPKSFYDKILPTLKKIIPNTFVRGI